VARVHAVSVLLFLAATVMAALLTRTRAAPEVTRAATVLLAVLVAQAAVGYTQYFLGVPVALVGIHVAGAVAVWVATLRFALSTNHAVDATPFVPTPELAVPASTR
jgi:cytochrome c oxidase assembly protein subunit 15